MALLVSVLAIQLSDGGDRADLEAAEGAISDSVAACTDVDRFADRMSNLGITYDYDPSDSDLELAARTDVVARGELIGVREATDSTGSFVVFQFEVTASSNDSLAAGDRIEVNAEFGPASVPYRDLEESFAPRIPSVLFLYSGFGPGGWTTALEGFWVSCGDDRPARSARVTPSFWAHDGSLAELFAGVTERPEDQVAPDEVESPLGFVADGIEFRVDCSAVPELRLDEQLGSVDLNDGQQTETSTIAGVDTGDALAVELAPVCGFPPGWILALRSDIEPIRLQQVLGALISADTLVSEVRELTEDERQRMDDDEGVGIFDCPNQGSQNWDYGPVDDSEPQGESPVDGLVKALQAVFDDDALTLLPTTGWVHLTDDNPGTAIFLATDEAGKWIGVAHIGGSPEAGIWRPNSIDSCWRVDNSEDPGATAGDIGEPAPAMCVGIEPFLGGEPMHGSMEFGDAWPVLDDDLILSNGFGVVAYNDGAVRGTLLVAETNPPDNSVFVDGAGGLVVQTSDRIVHARADRTLTNLTVEEDASLSFPGYQLGGTAQIQGEWFAYATKAPENAFEVGLGDLVLLPLDGGPEQVVAKILQEEGGARPFYDSAGEVFVLDWGSLGDRWITGVTVEGQPVDLAWNQWREPAFYDDRVILGVNGWQAYRGTYDRDGNLTIEGFNSSNGNTVYPLATLPVDLFGFEHRITRLIPLEDRVVVSATTPEGPCTRIFGPDLSFVDIPVRGFASPPVGLYGISR